MLKDLGYSMQPTVKTIEGAQHRDRDEQFNHINKSAKKFIASSQPVVSVDCKKKELVGEGVPGYKNPASQWRPKHNPEKAGVHDFPDKNMPKAIPYGVYDIGADEGWVSVSNNHDTAAFAVNAIRRWWETMSKERYPKAKRLMVTADAGGSNGYRNKLWKVELSKLAAETGLELTVCHYPPGTSKWNKIEHRLFSFISTNWRGQKLTSYRTVVELVVGIKTATGLSVHAEWDQGEYTKGIKITDKELTTLPIVYNK